MALNAEAVTRVLASVRGMQDRAHRLRRDIERYEEAQSQGEENPVDVLQESDSEADARGYFAGSLRSYFHALTIGLEAAGLPGEAEALRREWGRVPPAELGKTTWDGEHEYSASEPLAILDHTLDGLIPLGVDGVAERELLKLEQLLAATATILLREGKTPTRELDVQEVMHRYLQAYYDGQFVKTPSIRGALQEFEADCGIAHLKAAIEFKFVDSENEARTAVRGILEDTAGYQGSLDWTHWAATITFAG